MAKHYLRSVRNCCNQPRPVCAGWLCCGTQAFNPRISMGNAGMAWSPPSATTLFATVVTVCFPHLLYPQWGFVVDFFASSAWLMQIALVIVYHEVPGANPNTALVIMEVIRWVGYRSSS